MLLQVIAPSELRETSGWGSVPAHIRAGWVETALAQVQTSLEVVAEPLRAVGIVALFEFFFLFRGFSSRVLNGIQICL